MTIQIKDLIDQSVTLASERRQEALSKQEAKRISGGGFIPLSGPPLLGLYARPKVF